MPATAVKTRASYVIRESANGPAQLLMRRYAFAGARAPATFGRNAASNPITGRNEHSVKTN